jgi:hypothetical protein
MLATFRTRPTLLAVLFISLLTSSAHAQSTMQGWSVVNGIDTITMGLASPAVVTGTTNISSSSAYFTCSATPGCGFTGANIGLLLNVGQGPDGFPLVCQGPAIISAVAGNTVTLTNMEQTCTSGTGSYRSVFGPYGNVGGNVLNLVPAQGLGNLPGVAPSTYAGFWLDYDGSVHLNANYNSQVRTWLDLDTDGVAALISDTTGISIGTNFDNPSNQTGAVCIQGTQPLYTGCGGTSWLLDGPNGAFGRLRSYNKIIGATPTMTPTDGTLSAPGNSEVYTDGQPFIVQSGTTNETITPFASGVVTWNPLYTTPGPGQYGARTEYELKGQVFCAANCSSGEKGYVQVVYADSLGPRTMYTCGSSGPTGNLFAICDTAPTTGWNFASNPVLNFDFRALFVSESQNIVLNIVTTAGSQGQPSYYVKYVLEIH